MQMQQMKGEEQRAFSEVAPAGKYTAYRLPIVLLTIRSLNYQFAGAALKKTFWISSLIASFIQWQFSYLFNYFSKL